jgi:hypothetical protein
LLGARETLVVAVDAVFVIINLPTPIIIVAAITLAVECDEAYIILVCGKPSIYVDGVKPTSVLNSLHCPSSAVASSLVKHGFVRN